MTSRQRARSWPKLALPTGSTINYMGLPQYLELLKVGQVVRDQLKEIGITMDIEQVDVSVWFDRFVKGDYHITSADQERTIDPDNFYSLVLLTGAPINTTFYSNSEVDSLIGQKRRSNDMAKRKQLYSQVARPPWARRHSSSCTSRR